MTLNGERERFDNLILLFNEQSLSMSKDSSNNILPLEFPSDEVRRSVDLNFTMRVNFSDKGDSSFSNRDVKMPVRIDIPLKGKTLRQMPEGFPEAISEYSRESCAMFFLSKSSMWFLIIVIPQKLFILSFKSSKSRTVVPSKHPFLPEGIKTFNRCIPSRFSLRDKYQMDSQKQMESDNLRKAEGVASSTSSRHFIVHLGYPGNSHESPRLNQMFAQGDGLLIGELTCESRMACHIYGIEGIESFNPFGTSEVSRSNKVCLMEVSHPLCFNVRIWLSIAISFSLSSPCLPLTRENLSNSRNRWNIMNLSLFELPMYSLCSNAREGKTTSFVRFQFFPDRKYLFNHTLWGLPPDSFWDTALVFETFKTVFFKSFEPFGEPSFASLNQLKYFIETISFFIKLYCFAAFLIFVLTVHRLLLPKVFGRSLGDVGSRCYYIFKVHDVIR